MTLLGLLLLLAVTAAVPAGAACPHQAADLRAWSSAHSWSDGQVPSGGDITIDSPILLDVSTAPMGKITIAAGGRLVFDPSVDSLKLTANMVELTGGELWIGAEDCPFTGDAEVLLTGQRDESEGAPSVQKAILVREGVLEIHGEPRKSWTQIASTVTKTTDADGIGSPIYRLTDEMDITPAGFHLYEFNADGTGSGYWGRAFGPSKLNKVSSNTGKVIMLVISRRARFGQSTPEAMADAVETICFGGSRQSAIRDMTDDQRIGYVAICHLGSPENSVEKVATTEINGRSTTGRLVQRIGDVDFAAMSMVSLDGTWVPVIVDAMSYAAGTAPSLERVITLQEPVDWVAGDRVVMASTDFHYDQAEEFDLLECAECSSSQVKITAPVWFTHWGEVTDGVEMFAEVGLLTRNVRIHGEMEDECYGDNLCDEFDFDNFGGQIKMLHGFTSARIENAELFHMGQQAILGSYPIHYHMCLDTSGKDAYVRGNAIHNTFLRCLTIHGTHNVTVEDNVGYDSLGHCFFLEDGGEQDNRFINNLGLNTKAGLMIPTDKQGQTSTFWISNPDNELIGNHAAGSEGIGIWILMPEYPTGPSANADMGLVPKQTFRTPVKAFHGNVVHSNKRVGFRLDDTLEPDGTVTPASYKPLVDPTDPSSDYYHLQLDDLVAYKNSEGAWVKSMWTLLTNWRFAENGLGLVMASAAPGNRDKHFEVLANSRFVGNTANKGEPAGEITLPSGETITMDRSVPRRDAEVAQLGVAFYRGPVHVVDTSFAGFTANALRKAGAIGKKPSNPYLSSPIASVRNATFDFVDPTGGSRFFDGDGSVPGFDERDGNRHNVVLDWDGSLTTYPRASLIRPIPMLMNARCTLLPNWGPGTAICPDRFSRLSFGGTALLPTFMTRNDLQSTETETPTFEQQISYSMNTKESYIMHFNTTVPARFVLTIFGLQQGLYQLAGVCVGANQQVVVRPRSFTAANTIDEVLADESNSKYFYDPAVGVVVFRFTNPNPRGEDTMSHCPGTEDAELNGNCDNQKVVIILPSSNEDGDCRARAYPAYATQPISAEGALPVPVFS